jgi:hypothetical protein
MLDITFISYGCNKELKPIEVTSEYLEKLISFGLFNVIKCDTTNLCVEGEDVICLLLD